MLWLCRSAEDKRLFTAENLTKPEPDLPNIIGPGQNKKLGHIIYKFNI